MGSQFRIAFLPTLLLVSSTALGQNHWLNDAFPPEQRVHDFGTVARAAKTEHRFAIKNTSGQVIELSGIRTSCGCTTPTIETRQIQPGQTGYIHAKFNTGSFKGQKQATVTVTVRRPIFTEIQLVCKGYIRSDVVVHPGEAAFGQVVEGNAKELTLSIDYAGRSDWAIQSVSSDLDFLTAEAVESSRSAGRVRYDLRVALSPTAPIGFLKNQIVLHTNDLRLKAVPVAVTAEVQPSIQLSPSQFALGNVEAGKALSKRLVVKGQEPFRILQVTSPDVGIEFAPIPDPKQAHLVQLKVLPKAGKQGSVQGQIFVKTDLRDEPLKIDLSYSLKKVELPTSKKLD